MKRPLAALVGMLLLAAAALLGYAQIAGGGSGKCRYGVCVQVELGTPIGLNVTVPVTVTVRTQEDVPNLKLSLVTDSPKFVPILGNTEWVYDAKANQVFQAVSSVRFPLEGYTKVYAAVINPLIGDLVVHSQLVLITQAGSILNPTGKEWNPTRLAVPGTPRPPAPTATPYRQDYQLDRAPQAPIPDDGAWLSFTEPITGQEKSTVAGVDVKLWIVHLRGQDLVVELVGPDGKAFRVWDRKVPAEADYEGRPIVIQAHGVTAFNGQSFSGNWTLRVRDEAPGEAGTLYRYLLNIGHWSVPYSSAPLPHIAAGVASQAAWQTVGTRDFEGTQLGDDL